MLNAEDRLKKARWSNRFPFGLQVCNLVRDFLRLV